MKYRLLRFSLLCMLVMLCGGSMWAEDVVATLTGANMMASTSPGTSYADYTASETFTGLKDNQGNAYFGRWTYQKNGQNYLNMVQIKKVESSNTTRIQLPKYSGNIKKITLSVTNASSTAYDNGTGASTRLAIINSTTYTSSVANNASNQVLVVGSSSTANKTYEFDFTQLENSYDGGGLYICSLDAAARIWSIVVTHDDGSSDTRTETALVFDGDYQTTGTAGGSMALPTALVKTVVDGVQTGTLNEPTITWESSNTTVATIADGTISFLKGGKTTITASYAGSSSYKSCSNSFDLTIGGAITDGVFDFNNNQDYGSGAIIDASGYITEDKTWTAGNVTLVTSGKYRWYTDGTLRLYAPDDGNTTLKLSVPEGNKITAITITGSSINSLTASIGTYTSGTWSGSAQEVTLSRGSDNSQVKTITVTYTSASAPEAPTFDPAAGNYYGPQNVTLTCTTEGADIYYSTDGENISKYTAPIEVSATTTISAYSQVGEEKSATVTATYTIRTLYTTIAQLHENVTGANTPIGFQPESVTVVYVNGNNGYLVDNAGNGLLVFNNSGLKVNGETDLAAGQVLTGGMIRGSLVSYQGSTEISGFTTEGTTITNTEVTPVEKTLPLNTDDDQSTLVTVKGLTYTAEGSTFSDGTNTIAYYDKFKANPTLEDGKKYDVTAIAVKYDNAIQLCPRTAADVTEYVAPTPDPFYILGVEGWELPASMKAMTWNAENEAYEYTLNNTSTAYFCFSQTNEINENDWETFNSNYRYGNGIGNFAADEYINSENSITLSKIGGEGNIQLNTAGQWTISVTQDMKMTITGEATPVEEHTYIVAGGYEGELSVVNYFDPLLSTRWNGSNEDNKMTKQDDGSYKLELTNKILYKGTYEFKIVEGNDWVPANNIQQTISETGIYNAVFTFYPENAESSTLALTKQDGDITIVAAGGFSGEDAGLENVLFTTTWQASLDANKLTELEDGTFTKVYEKVALPAATIEYKIVINDDDWVGDSQGANLTYAIAEAGNYDVTVTYNPITRVAEMTAVAAEEPVVGFRDIKADLTQLQSLATNSAVLITVADDGTIGTTDDETKAAAKLKGGWHGTAYGWTNFTADVPVEGCVKITYATHDYGNDIIVTNEAGDQVAKFSTMGAKWSSSHDNVVVAYYRTNEPTTLHFSNANYNPYFAVEAIAEEDLPAEVTNYNVTFVAGEGVEGVAPAAVEVEAGNKITAPANYTLYKDGSTLTGWTDGETTYAPGDEITPAADMQLTAVFTENTVNLADRTEAVTVTFPLNGYNNNPQHKLNNGGIIVTQVTIGESSIDVKADVTGSLVANGSGWHYASNSCAISVPSCKGASMTVTTYSDPSNAIKFENNAPKSVTGTANPYTASYETASTDATLAIAATSDIYISNIAITLPVVSGDDPTEDTELFSWVYDTSTTALDAVINGTNGSVTLKNTGTDAFSAEGATYTSKIADDMAPTKGLKFGKNTQYIVISLTEGNFQAGDEISVCGYNEIMFCASADRTNTIGDVATGSSKGDYKVGTFTIPENFTAQSTLYIFRKNGSGTGIAAIQAIRPGHDPNFVATPVITPKTGTYANEQEVTITCETENANIYYTLDGTDPTAQSTAYTDKFTVTETTTVKAIAIKGDYFSEIGESVITIVNIQPGESNLEWDYTDKNIPEEKEETDPMYEDNGLFYASFVNDKVGENVQNNGMNGVKLNSSGKAWFAKNPVAGKLTLTFGFRNSNDAFSVNVYECSIDGNTANRGNLIGSVSVDASPGTGSINIPAEVTGIWIERKTTSAEGVLSKIVFKETVQRTFQDFEITNEQLKGTVADMNLPEGVTLTGTQPAANNNAHGYSGATIIVPTDGGAVKFTIGGCQYNNSTFTVKNSNNETVATLSNKTTKCYHQDGSVVTYFYTGEATTLTFSTIENLPYFKAEAVDVEEVTVTYKDQNGEVLGTKKVIEGSAIGEAPYTEADLTIAEGYAFRGWIYTNGVKVKATDIVDGNKTVMASVTAIEEAPTTGSIQVYDLTQTTFYPEDHENFDVNGGSWHDGQHGFSFGNGNSFSVKVSSKAQVVVTLCQHSSEGTVTVKDANNNSVGEGFNAKVASCGETAVVKYEGDATTLTFTFAATAYIHDVKVYNVNVFPEKDEATGYYMVPAGDAVALVLAINSASAEANSKIFLPNSTYDLGELVKTTISGTNVSIIGESMEGVIIKNSPTTEGIDVTATLLNTSSNLYMQDLTIECDAPWIGNAERGVTLQDKGNQTILKNVYLKGKQDTYYSNNPDGTFYFENGMIQGSVDYVCGYGDVYFNNTSFYTVNKSTGGKGGCIAAPNTLKSFGYIFSDCTLDGVANEDGQYRLARPWAANTKCFFVNTTMKIKPFDAGWGEWSNPKNAVIRFAEYNSVDANGDAIDLTGRATTIGDQPNSPILTEAEAAALAVDQIFAGDWKPQVIAQQVAAPKAELKDGVITWTPANDGATAYAIFKDGKFLGITTDSSWTVEEVAGAPHRAGEEPQTTGYTIRAANSRGGFGEPAEVSLATAITNINAELNGDVKIYDLQGRQVKTATKGVYIINGKKVVIK